MQFGMGLREGPFRGAIFVVRFGSSMRFGISVRILTYIFLVIYILYKLDKCVEG